MRYLILTTVAALTLILGACSRDEAPPAAPTAEESTGSGTQVDTDNSAVPLGEAGTSDNSTVPYGEDEEDTEGNDTLP